MNLLPKQLRSETRVPVFDPEDCNLCLVALCQRDRAVISLRSSLLEKDADFLSCQIHYSRHTEIPSPLRHTWLQRSRHREYLRCRYTQ